MSAIIRPAIIWWERFEVTREKREWTPGRLKAAARAVKMESDKMALFPELRRISSVEDRMQSMDTREDTMVTRLRACRAKQWREIRQELRILNPGLRSRVLAKWNTRYTPGAPSYLSATIKIVLSRSTIQPTT